MSTPIGFAPGGVSEIERLRKAYDSLNDVTRNLASVERCLQRHDIGLADAHLKAAEWHAIQAKQQVTNVGQSRAEAGCRRAE